MASAPEPLLYFLAGALLPSLAYFLLLRNPRGSARDDEYGSDDDDDSDAELFDHATVPANSTSDPSSWGIRHAPYKMVLCVNQELKMGKGKIAAQCGHAALGAYQRAQRTCPAAVRAWQHTGCAKIAVKIDDHAAMQRVAGLAKTKGIPLYLVEDAGRTQIAAGSRTVLGLGPAPVSVFDGVTDSLKLL